MTDIVPPFPPNADLFTFYPMHPDYSERWLGFELTPFQQEVKDRAERLAVDLQLLIQAHHPRMSLLKAYDFVKPRHTFPDGVTAAAVLDFLGTYWWYGGIDALRQHIGLTTAQ